MSCRRITSKSNALQTTAVNEGIPSNAGDAVANNHTRQTTVFEGPAPNAGDAVGDPRARYSTAVIEGRAPNAGDRFPLIGGRNYQLSRGIFVTTNNGDLSSRDPVCLRIRINLINPAEQQHNHGCKSWNVDEFHYSANITR